MLEPRKPTAEECATNAQVPIGDLIGQACWYPQMGGYVGMAVAVRDGDCVDVFVWHDGTWPFDGHCHVCSSPRQPVRLHHCDGEQFVEFGRFLTMISSDGSS